MINCFKDWGQSNFCLITTESTAETFFYLKKNHPLFICYGRTVVTVNFGFLMFLNNLYVYPFIVTKIIAKTQFENLTV